MEASLYIHVPFCACEKCDYCDFYSVPLKPAYSRSDDLRLAGYVQTLLSEADRLFKTYSPEKVPALYIGGGTPSVLSPAGIRRLLRGILEIISRYSPLPMEVTVEANPESADEAFLGAAREAGASRLSLGLQTFFAPSRQTVGRNSAGGADESLLHRRLASAAEYFPGAFSADIISGLPFQDERILLNDIEALLSHRPAHVSLYALTVEKGTPLAEKKETKRLLPSAEKADSLWLAGRDALEKSGFSQYEVSNFCLNGKESVHNIRYWRMQNWLALGPAASATIIDDETGKGFRYTIPRNVNSWMAAGGCTFSRESFSGLVPETEDLDAVTLMKESILMGFRYIEGPDELLFQHRFRRSIKDCIPKTIEEWRNRKLFRQDKIALTKDGLVFLNRFLLDAFEEVESSSSNY